MIRRNSLLSVFYNFMGIMILLFICGEIMVASIKKSPLIKGQIEKKNIIMQKLKIFSMLSDETNAHENLIKTYYRLFWETLENISLLNLFLFGITVLAFFYPWLWSVILLDLVS